MLDYEQREEIEEIKGRSLWSLSVEWALTMSRSLGTHERDKDTLCKLAHEGIMLETFRRHRLQGLSVQPLVAVSDENAKDMSGRERLKGWICSNT